LKKLLSKFNDDQKQLFVQNFVLYLHHHQQNDFVIDMDDIWEWLGFSIKQKAKDLLVRHFARESNYKISTNQAVERVHGGQNREKITMNIKTFKKLCLKAGTKKADKIHDYYITMEEVMQEYILERAQRQSKLEREKTLIQSFDKKPVNYFRTIGKIDGVDIGKFGWSNNVGGRIEDHKKELGENFVLECVVECERNILLEKKLNAHHEIIQRRVKKIINEKVQTELVKLDEDFQPEDVRRIMHEINEEIQTEVDKQRRHEERMLELHIQEKQLDVELKKLDIQSQQIQLQSPQARCCDLPVC
jgi:hypothetical protein